MEFLPSLSTLLLIVGIGIAAYILFRIFKMLLSLLFFALFLLIAYLTNPGPVKHQQAVERKAAKEDIPFKSKSVKVNDFKLLSFTQAGKENKIVGVGAFTQVFIFRDLNEIK